MKRNNETKNNKPHVQELIFNYIQSNPGCSITDIMDNINNEITDKCIYDNINILMNAKYIMQVTNGTFVTCYSNKAKPDFNQVKETTMVPKANMHPHDDVYRFISQNPGCTRIDIIKAFPDIEVLKVLQKLSFEFLITENDKNQITLTNHTPLSRLIEVTDNKKPEVEFKPFSIKLNEDDKTYIKNLQIHLESIFGFTPTMDQVMSNVIRVACQVYQNPQYQPMQFGQYMRYNDQNMRNRQF